MPCIARQARPLVLHGTLTTFRRRCGKPSCRCASGDAHESPALTYSEGGRTKTLTLGAGEVAEVKAALARYDSTREELESAAREGIVALRSRRGSRR